MHRADPQVLAAMKSHGLGIFWANVPNAKIARRIPDGRGHNFAIGAMVNGLEQPNALKIFASCNAAARGLRLSRHTQP